MVPDWAEGQSRSVQAGLAAARPSAPSAHRAQTGADERRFLGPSAFIRVHPRPILEAETGGEVSAVLFLLADQPGVSPELLAALIGRYRETLAPVVATRYQGQRGNPALFDRETFGEFARLSGDIGARPILQAHADEIAWVEWPTSEITQDIDVAADYRASQDWTEAATDGR
jgi:CTP:molybdopterin cytidylyltransferase MocA